MTMTGKKLISTVTLAELKKRLPMNQVKQFEEFNRKCFEYQKKVAKNPHKLPHIDWDYYRSHVGQDIVNVVDQFEVQYHELDKAFEARHELDYSKYYEDWKRIVVECKEDIAAFKKASDERIQKYEMELKRLSEMKPFEEMTIEEFLILRGDLADSVPGQQKPLYWPPIEEEQFDYDPSQNNQQHDHQKHNEYKTETETATKAESNSKPPKTK